MEKRFWLLIATTLLFLSSTFAQTGNTLNFDGVDDFVMAPNSTAFSVSKYTIETWVYWTPAANTDIQFITSKGAELMEMHTGVTPNTLRFIPRPGLYLDAAGVLPTNKWTHIAAVYNPNNLTAKLYINGVEVTLVRSNTSSANIGDIITTNNNPLSIGVRYDLSFKFKGSIDELRVFADSRTAAEVKTDMLSSFTTIPTSLFAYYKFNEGVAGATNTGITTAANLGSGVGLNASLSNFALSGTTSNWIESYAMMATTATAATAYTANGFTANWTAPTAGTVDNYLLDISTSSDFSSFVSGYNGFSIAGTNTSYVVTGLSDPNNYYRVRANKTSVPNQGFSLNSIATINPNSDAFLTNLSSNTGAFNTSFSSTTTAYSKSVLYAVNSTTVTPTLSNSSATMEIRLNGGSYTSINNATASSLLNLNIGTNTIDIRVTAINGTTQKIYTLTVTRANPAPSISAAVYDITTGVFTATGVDFFGTAGANNDIDIAKLTISGQAGATYTLTSNNVDITDASHFSVTLNATDKAGLLTLLNKNGTTANDATVYNVSAAANWLVNQPGNADLTGNGITVSNVATITTTGTLTSFNACPGFNSAAQNFTISGTALTANILLTAPTGYEISTSSGSGFANSLSLNQSSGVVSSATIYARLTTTATGSPTGNITAASTNAVTQNKAVSGFVSAFPAPFATRVQVYAGTATVAALTATGSSIQWYAATTGGSALVNTTPLVNGTVYYASQGAGGCESVGRFGVTAKQISNASQAFCNSGTVANLTSTTTAGTTAAWFAAATGGTALANTAALSTGNYYIQEQKVFSTIDFSMGGTSPVALAVQPDGKVVFSSTDGTINRMNADGSGKITLATGLGGINAIAVQANGKILMVDPGITNVVRRMDANGTNIVTLASGFTEPTGIAVEADGKFLVADYSAQVIKRFNEDGSLNTTLLLAGSGIYPKCIAVQADGKILIADVWNFTIKRINADGTNPVTLANLSNTPYAIAIEADGKILITDNNNRLLRMDADGTNPVEIAAGFQFPLGVASQADGKILVADLDNGRIQQITTASNSNRVAVAITVNNTSVPTGIASQVYAGTATLANLTAMGSNIQWYAAATGGTALANTTALVNGSSYYASQTANSCESVTRLAVAVQQISASSATKCDNETLASLSSSATAGFVPVWYSAASGGAALANNSLLSTGNYYIEQQQSINNSTDIGSFSNPYGVKSQADGKVLVTDMGVNKLYRMDVNGANRVELATGFNVPTGIAVQADGKIYIADVANNVVKRFNADGSNMVVLGAGFSNPTAIAIEANGKILVLSNDAISRMDADGSNQAIIVSGLSGPADIAVQADGKILIADYNNNAIKRYNADGSNMVVLGSGFNKPSGVAIQPDGKIVVADRFNNQIKRMDANGVNIEILGSGINRPLSVAIHSDGSILVGNQAGSNIIRIVETGIISSNRIPVAVTVNSLPVVSITGSTSIAVNSSSSLSPVSGGVWASNNTAVATVNNAGAVTGISAGSTSFAFTQTSTGCTSLPTASFTVALPTIASATYNVTSGELVVTGNYFAATTGANNDIDIAKITITGQNASTYTLTSANVEISSATSFTVSLNATDKAALISVLNKNGSIAHSSTVYNIGAAANWNTAVSGNADVTGNALTVSNAINIATTASLTAMTATYGSASTTQSFTVSGVSLTNNILVTPPSGFEVSTTAASGYAASVSLSSDAGTVNATTIYIRLKANNMVAGSPYAGNVVVSSTNAESQYIVIASSTVGTKALTITATNATKTYGQTLVGATGSTAFTSVGLVGTETIGTVTIAYVAGSAANANVGTYTGSVTPSAATGGTFTASNYNITYATGNIIVAQATLTITASVVNKTYGQVLTGAAGSTAFTNTALQNGETVGAITRSFGTGAAANANVGTYTGSVTPSAATGGTFTASNYTISYATGNIVVGAAALTITANAANKTYGQSLVGASGSTAFTSVGLVGTETIGSVMLAYGSGAAANAAVGTYTGSVTPSAAIGGTFTASNYTITYSTGNIVVGATALTIIANAANKTYGQSLVGASGSTSFTSVGLIGTETIGTVTIAYGLGAAANAVVGTYAGSVTPSAAIGGSFTASNYNITYAAGNIIINKTIIIITGISVSNKVYDATTVATISGSPVLVGLIGSDNISVGGTIVASFNNSTVGLNKPVSVSGYNLIGNAATNYTLIEPTGFSANITPKFLSISGITANNKKFDGNTTALLSGTAVLNGIVGNDNITIVGNPVALFASSAVGTNIVVTVTGYSISGSASGNYTLSAPLLLSADIILDAPIILSNNADLSAIAISSGILSPVFASATTAYTANVTNATTTITVTPTVSQANATLQLRINNAAYATVASGAASSALSLNAGSNTIDVRVTAQDGTTIKTYTVTVTRTAAATPVINITGSVLPFSTCLNGMLTAQRFSVSGDNLLANIGLTAPIGFELSMTENGVFSNNIALLPINGILPTTTVFVRFITSTAGNYSGDIVVSSAGATSQNIQLSGTVNPLPTIAAITGIQQVCVQSNTSFSSATAGGIWSSSNTSVATINAAGLIIGTQAGTATISYTLTNASGCITTVTRDINVNALPQVTAVANPALVLKGLTTQLSATGTAASYAWSPAANLSTPTQANTTARITDNTTFTVTATSAQGCIATASVSVAIIPDAIFVEPTNVFTPNGDGINDRFVIKNLDQYPNNKLQIFDRNGKVVYEQNNYANTWDGTISGKILTKDTYFYVLTIKGQIVKRGTFTVLR